MIKKIFITPFFEKNKYNKIVYSLNEEWFKYLKSLNFEFEILTPYNLHILKKNTYGVILSGGGDLYKFKKNIQNLLRDKFEKKIIKICQSKKIKILGVCRGLQLVGLNNNCTFVTTKTHYLKKQHKIIINKNKYLRSKHIFVNSFHNFKIQNISNKFVKIGQSLDSSCEIIIGKNRLFLGLMFHPERKNISQKEINKLIKRWFN